MNLAGVMQLTHYEQYLRWPVIFLIIYLFCLDAALSGCMSNLQDCVHSNRGSINTTFVLMYHGRLNGGRTAVVANSLVQNLGILSSY